MSSRNKNGNRNRSVKNMANNGQEVISYNPQKIVRQGNSFVGNRPPLQPQAHYDPIPGEIPVKLPSGIKPAQSVNESEEDRINGGRTTINNNIIININNPNHPQHHEQKRRSPSMQSDRAGQEKIRDFSNIQMQVQEKQKMRKTETDFNTSQQNFVVA